MEADAALALYKILFFQFNKTIVLQNKVSDDDSIMRSLLNHITTHPRGWVL